MVMAVVLQSSLKAVDWDWKWKRVRILGIGGFSCVSLATREDDYLQFAVKSVAMKAVDEFEAMSIRALENEIQLLQRLHSKYIIKYLGYGFSKLMDVAKCEREALDMYMEYLPKGNLTTFVQWHQHNKPGPMSETWIATFTLDILRALEYLHKNGIAHGDIKGENVLFGSDCMKLVDFGSAKDCSLMSKILEGTKCYMAPEVASKVESTSASDIFSLGCVVIEMATGQPPYETLKGKEYAKYIPENISDDAQDFLKTCLKTNPKLRLSASQLLNHAFILNNFQSLNPRLRPKGADGQFPFDCQYFARRPPEDNCYRVHFVDTFRYSGPAPVVLDCGELSDAQHAAGGREKQQTQKGLNNGNHENFPC